MGAAAWISLQKNTSSVAAAKTDAAETGTGRPNDDAVVVDEETALLGARDEYVRR